MGVGAIEVGVDSRGVVNGINNMRCGNIMGGMLIVKIREFIRINWVVVINHVYREAN